ncbi:MAG: hypothetical protein V4665_01985 [Patescibacteria group bacterium]
MKESFGLEKTIRKEASPLPATDCLEKEHALFSVYKGKAKTILKTFALFTALHVAVATEAQNVPDSSSKEKIENIKEIYERDKAEFLDSVSSYMDTDRDSIVPLILTASKEEPLTFLRNAHYFKTLENFNFAEEVLKAAKECPLGFMENAEQFVDVPGINVQEIIINAAQKEPRDFLRHADHVKNLLPSATWQELTENGFAAKPDLFEEFKNILNQLPEPKSTLVQALKRLPSANALPLLNSVLKNNLSEDEISKIISDDDTFFKELIKIKSDTNHILPDQVDLALKSFCQGKVSTIDQLHELPDPVRFKSIENATPEEMYLMMVYSSADIFTSSFNGLFDRMIKKMKNENISGSALLQKVRNNRFKIFVKECTSFKRLNDFLATMEENDASQLLVNMLKDIEKTSDKVDQAIVVADIFGDTKDKKLLQLLEEEIKIQYERVSSLPDSIQENVNLYGLIASIYAKNPHAHHEWFQGIAEKYKLKESNMIESKDLFNKNNINIQHYFFYKDIDGESSFQNFLHQYENDPDWNIEKKESYIVIKSSKGGRSMEIYANYPTRAYKGQEAIQDILTQRNLDVNVVVHRGHSYHVDETYDAMTKNPRIISLGACGGNKYQEMLIKRSSSVNILSTKGTGTRAINDYMYKELNTLILSGENIVWSEFWEKMKQKFKNNKDFAYYSSPDQDYGQTLLKTFYENSAVEKKTAHYYEGVIPAY